MTKLLLEQPWPLLLALGILAFGLAVVANRQIKPKLWLGSLGAVALAMLVALLAWQIETPAEQAIHMTRQLVTATCPLDIPRLRSVMAPTAQVIDPNRQTIITADRLLDTLDRVVKVYPITTQSIRQIEADDDNEQSVLVELTLGTGLGSSGSPTPTQWRLTWVHEKGQSWKLAEIQWLSIWTQPPSASLLP